jgi:hypothetical protein
VGEGSLRPGSVTRAELLWLLFTLPLTEALNWEHEGVLRLAEALVLQ